MSNWIRYKGEPPSAPVIEAYTIKPGTTARVEPGRYRRARVHPCSGHPSEWDPRVRASLVKTYAEFQRNELRCSDMPPALRCFAEQAWGAELAIKVAASEHERKERDRLQVVVDTSWWDD